MSNNAIISKFIIPGEFVSANEYIAAERTNKFIASKIKKDETNRVKSYARKSNISLWADHRYLFLFDWYCKNQKKDPDNIAFAKKFLMDGIKESGVIPSDGWKNVLGFNDHFFVDADKPRVEVTIIA